MPFRETSAADLSSGPVGFGIDVTTDCNLDCVTCYYRESSENRPALCDSNLPMAQFERAMDKVAAAGFREIYILGGEPTLHPRIVDMLESAMSLPFEKVLLVTNGLRLADRDFCRRVAASGAHIVVQRHVMGEGDETRRIQDAVAGCKDTLDQVNRAFVNIERMFDPAKVAVQCCLTRPVVESEQVFGVYRYAKQRGFEHVIECTKASVRFTRGNPLDLSPGELTRVYEQLQQIDIEEFDGIPHPMTPQAFGKTCHMPENGVHCLADGTIVPCVGQPFPLGNIFSLPDTPLTAILDSPERAFFRNPLGRLHGHCRDCLHVEVCTGGCRGDAYFLTGCFNASAVQCPQLASSGKKLVLRDFVPSTCRACQLEGHSLCGPKGDTAGILSGYLGALYQDESAT